MNKTKSMRACMRVCVCSTHSYTCSPVLTPLIYCVSFLTQGYISYELDENTYEQAEINDPFMLRFLDFLAELLLPVQLKLRDANRAEVALNLAKYIFTLSLPLHMHICFWLMNSSLVSSRALCTLRGLHHWEQSSYLRYTMGGVQSAECGVQSAECRVQSAECRVKSEEWRVKSEEWRVKSEEWRVKSEEWRVKNVLLGMSTSNFYNPHYDITGNSTAGWLLCLYWRATFEIPIHQTCSNFTTS